MPHDIFISYSRKNLDAVKPIKEELEAHGLSCWMDLEGIESGSPEFTLHITDAINESATVLFFLSAHSQASEWSLNELRFAKSKRKRIVLVRFNDDGMTDVFSFNFGGTDIIDWRDAEQRGKLLRDLRNWKNDDKIFESNKSTPSLSRMSPSEMIAIPLECFLPWQDFRLIAGIEFNANNDGKRIVAHVVASCRGVFLVGFDDSPSDGMGATSYIPSYEDMQAFSDFVADKCNLLWEWMHFIFVVENDAYSPKMPNWVVTSAQTIDYFHKFQYGSKIIDWNGEHRELTRKLESLPMTHEGREANILKHFNAGTAEELEDGAALLAWADNPSEKLLDAAEMARYRLVDMKSLRPAEGVKAWFRVMADRGNVIAMDHYGWMLDASKAEERVFWFRKAAELGGAHAQNSLGYCLHEGLGVERNRDEALRLFRASAAQGNRFGQESLARAYYEPDFVGLPQNPAEAFRLLKLSAEQGWHWSQFHLGECYEKGFGTNPNMAEARRWYEKAAKALNEQAKAALARLNNQE